MLHCLFVFLAGGDSSFTEDSGKVAPEAEVDPKAGGCQDIWAGNITDWMTDLCLDRTVPTKVDPKAGGQQDIWAVNISDWMNDQCLWYLCP